LQEQNAGPLPDESVAGVFRQIIAACLALEQKLRVAYLGPPGTFSHGAVARHFGDFIDAVPAIIIFMPIVIKLNDLGDIKPLHMGVVIITTLVFGLITPPYGLSLLVASKFVGVRFSSAMWASIPIYVVFFVAIGFAVFLPDMVLWLPKLLLPESVGCFKSPTGAGYICPP